MFGLIKKQARWDWAAFGKHPVAGDYLAMGKKTPLLEGFSKWVEKGYLRLSEDHKARAGVFWQFWAKGPNGKLVCGVIKSSYDRYGRPYPFLIVGEGKSLDIMRSWDLIPLACQQTWMNIETLADKHIAGIKELRKLIKQIGKPAMDLKELTLLRERLKSVEIPKDSHVISSDFMNKMNSVDGLARMIRFSVLIDIGNADEFFPLVSKLIFLLKTRSAKEPDMVFTGGVGDQKRLICLKRSLHVDDFVDLWAEV